VNRWLSATLSQEKPPSNAAALQDAPYHVSSTDYSKNRANCLSIAFILLLASIASALALAILDGIVGQSLTSALAAAGIVFLGVSARTADVSFAGRVTRGLRLAAAVAAIWMVVQILPTPFFSHSIWNYANEALNQKSWGHISVDIGKTIEALAFYLGNIALIVVGLFVSRDRRRAEITLFTLSVVATLTAITLLISRVSAGTTGSEITETLSAVSSLGVILSMTSGVSAFERYESRKAEATRPQNTRAVLTACGVGVLVCITGLAISATLNVSLCLALGIATFGSVQAIRRLGLGSWAIGVLIATLVITATMITVWRYDAARTLSPFLQFASAAPPDAISLAQRMLSDTGWQGTGAGTYASLLPVYQEFGSLFANAPSTASKSAIELGWPMTLFVIATAIALIVILYRGAVIRGRDSFYPAAAAACTIVILCQTFCDTSLLNSGIAVISDAVVGLGLAQSASQREGP
jgi:hypothetical protein